MRMKKIASFVMSAVIAAGVCTGVPIGSGKNSSLSITAEAAESDFVTRTYEGITRLEKYKGKGGDIVIPKEVDIIDDDVFAGNSNIKSVTIKGSYVEVYPFAFAECENLKKVVFEGDTLICTGAFHSSYNLESVTVKGSIKGRIYPYAFFGCQSLKTVKICKNEHEFVIAENAFRNCYSLTSINIPSKCTDIYHCAFLNCFSLEKLTIPANTKVYEKTGKYQFGYASLFNSPEDCYEYKKTGNEDKMNTFAADGKTSGYSLYFGDTGLRSGLYNDFYIDAKKYTPKKLTVTVTKGSSAEEWAKANKVKYVYAESSSDRTDKADAPENIKASKTKDSITLTWDKSKGAVMYRVYIYNDKTGKYEKYKDVKLEKCTVTGLSANTKYKFKVVAYDKVDGKYVKGGTSKVVTFTTKK